MVLVWLSPSTSPVGKAGTDPTAVWEDTNHAPVLTLKPLPVHGSGDLNMTFPGGDNKAKWCSKDIQQTPQNRGMAVYVPTPAHCHLHCLLYSPPQVSPSFLHTFIPLSTNLQSNLFP